MAGAYAQGVRQGHRAPVPGVLFQDNNGCARVRLQVPVQRQNMHKAAQALVGAVVWGCHYAKLGIALARGRTGSANPCASVIRPIQ